MSLRDSFAWTQRFARVARGSRARRFPGRDVFHHDDEPVAAGTRGIRHEYALFGFFLSQLGKAALLSIVSALLAVLAVVPGEPLYRVSQPDKIRLDVGLQFAGIRTKEFFTANVIGICLAAAHIGYITVFYIVSGKLGAWAPQDLSYTDVVSTWLPGLSADDWNLCGHK